MTAAELIHDELILDGNARLNLATFVTTWMEPEARSDGRDVRQEHDRQGRYPQTAELEQRCVDARRPVARPRLRWTRSAPPRPAPARRRCSAAWRGCAGGSARGPGKPIEAPQHRDGDRRPGVLGEVRRYWTSSPGCADDGERRRPHRRGGGQAPATRTRSAWSRSSADLRRHTSPSRRSPTALDRLRRLRLGLPIHVDAASGGFVAPFLAPDLEWTSGCRACSRSTPRATSRARLPGSAGRCGAMPPRCPRTSSSVSTTWAAHATFALNFSRPGGQVVSEYYAFVRLGARATPTCRAPAGRRRRPRRADRRDRAVRAAEPRRCAARLPRSRSRTGFNYTVTTWPTTSASGAGCSGLRFPARPLEETTLTGLSVRTGFSMDLALMLVDDIKRAIEFFDGLDAPMPRPAQQDKWLSTTRRQLEPPAPPPLRRAGRHRAQDLLVRDRADGGAGARSDRGRDPALEDRIFTTCSSAKPTKFARRKSQRPRSRGGQRRPPPARGRRGSSSPRWPGPTVERLPRGVRDPAVRIDAERGLLVARPPRPPRRAAPRRGERSAGRR